MADSSSSPSPTLNAPSMSVSLRQRLLSAETEFLAARDPAAFEEFGRSWDILCDDFQLALEQGIIDDDLKNLGTAICYRVAIVGESLLELHKEVSALDEDFNKLLAAMTLDDLDAPSPARPNIQRSPSKLPLTPTLPSHSRPPRQWKPTKPSVAPPKALKSSRPPFIAPAYSWLLNNFHDPYPSSQISRSIADEAGLFPNTISKWFKSMRAYIGWESLCRKRFAGQRRFAVTAAKRLFSSDSSQPDLPPDVAKDILAVKSKLDHLYSDEIGQRYTSATTTNRLDHQRQISTSSDDSIDAILAAFTASSRPSSPLSLDSSSSNSSRVPSLVFSSDSDSESGEVFSQPSISQGSGDHNTGTSVTLGLQHKSLGPSNVNQTCLDLRDPPCEGTRPSYPTKNPRKRRRSDADVSPPIKRVNTATTANTIHTQIVSAPISRSTVTVDLPSIMFQPFFQDESGETPSPRPSNDADLSQFVNIGHNRCHYSNAMPLHEQRVEEIWASDSRFLFEMIRDAPSSTTLKNLPLPNVGSSSDFVYPMSIEEWNGHVPYSSGSTALPAPKNRELPPIHWSSSSLAGALGPLNANSDAPSQPITAPSELLNETSSAEVRATPETQDSEPETSNSPSLDAILLSNNWGDPFGDLLSSSISSRLEEAHSSSSLQQLLDMLDSSLYAGPTF